MAFQVWPSPSKGPTAGKHLCVQSRGAEHGLGGLQRRLRTACGTATRQQVPSCTSNGQATRGSTKGALSSAGPPH